MQKPEKKPETVRRMATMRLPDTMLEQLTIAAEEDGRSRTSLVAKILAEWLKKNGYDK